MIIEEYREENPYTPTDEEILENNKYWDVDMLEVANAETNKGIEYWKGRYKTASSWLGKWAAQTKIDRLKKKLHKYVDKK